ncbi:GNAT family N-acetyltransferase [Streptomyces sp. NPDC059378]|uniref:GNAT family N-acetyltransferase n=1 Tax=Streptomyces sp. NPDC059378 TaxID=3346815 RepID=UPI0036A2229D
MTSDQIPASVGGVGSLGLSQITAVIHHGNTASSAVARRLGFTPLREDSVLNRPCTVHALARVDYLSPDLR